MLALAFLTIAAAGEHQRGGAPDDQIPFTRNEIASLLAARTRCRHPAARQPGTVPPCTAPATTARDGLPGFAAPSGGSPAITPRRGFSRQEPAWS
jgi:hypothetical protein